MNRIVVIIIFAIVFSGCQPKPESSLRNDFQNPPESAKPWVFWYWMRAAVTKEGITADLEAMKEAGIAGAYLMPIKGADNPPLIPDPKVQLTPEWWDVVKHAFTEADRLGLKLAMHASDGFALAGGPWITPELSMQKVVWADTIVAGGSRLDIKLPQPPMLKDYYKDISLFAYPTPKDAFYSSETIIPKVTASTGENVSYLVNPKDTQKFRSNDPCWIQYQFEKPFVCRSVFIGTGSNFQATRLQVEVSDNGKDFRTLGRLETPRHGWQDWDEGYTFAIEPTTAKYFRFVYNPEGTEPGAEDLDNAKWVQGIKISKLVLSGEARIGGIEGKNGSVWRIAPATGTDKISSDVCIDPSTLINLSDKLDSTGVLHWDAPAGNWTLLRMGCTTNGHTNYTAGGGLGLEVDKFNPEAVKFQYGQWCGKIIKTVGPELASRVLDIYHVDSWECGSQNWSPVFAAEFKKRRGYDLTSMLPAMAGVPVESAAASEKFLKDVRQTISELVADNFYHVFAEEIKKDGMKFSGECVAPTMTSDGMLHYRELDIPMGEFWLRSPTHDKPNDALDAISGAHIYGKPIIQAECFTELRMAWDEYPGMLKTLADRNFAQGFNKYVFHVFAQNPWPDRKPGMTLDPIGLFFQRDQTWWKPGKAWVEYITRCQSLLQQGKPVVDVAVFTGEEIPSRAILPERLVSVLPGIIGEERVNSEKIRMANVGLPTTVSHWNIKHAANITDPAQWVDPLNGYAYDSFNPDALLRLAKVENGKIVLPGGASYSLLVFPGKTKMDPNGNRMSNAVATKLNELVQGGATVMFTEKPSAYEGDKETEQILNSLFSEKKTGKGKILVGIYEQSSFESIGIEPDFMAFDNDGKRIKGMVWTHRSLPNADIYFLGNQKEEATLVTCSFRTSGQLPEIFNAVTGEITEAKTWSSKNERTEVPLRLEANGSLFIVFEKPTSETSVNKGLNGTEPQVAQTLDQRWSIQFDPAWGGPKEPVQIDSLKSWTTFGDFGIQHYSGTARYSKTFETTKPEEKRVWLDLGKVDNIAEVFVNGKSCGVAWTFPYRVEITSALQNGSNTIDIDVTNTWANRLMGDHTLPENERLTWTTAPYMLEGKPLLEAGLLGEVKVLIEN